MGEREKVGREKGGEGDRDRLSVLQCSLLFLCLVLVSQLCLYTGRWNRHAG
jgi:hypothetical protein